MTLFNGPMLFFWVLVFSEFGDYISQSDWMASAKATSSTPATVHALVYTLPFALISLDWRMLAIIGGSHFVIDRFRLARHVCWAKNFLAPPPLKVLDSKKNVINVHTWWHAWKDCQKTGYHHTRPDWLAVWLMIRADNCLHLIINGLAVSFFAQK